MKKNQRKYERYAINIPVLFMDDAKTNGRMINVSRNGCLLVVDAGTQIPLRKEFSFQAFLDGKVYPTERTSPGINVKDLSRLKPSGLQEVRITGQVMRFTIHEGKEAIGIQIIKIEKEDFMKWINFVVKKQNEQEVFNFGGFDDVDLKYQKQERRKYQRFTIRFKTPEGLIKFFPTTEQETFFIPTDVQRTQGTRIAVSLIHPESQDVLQVFGHVISFGPDPKRKNKTGLFCRIEEKHTESFKYDVNNFLKMKLYVI
ncbi:MAG: PilZ domain-containing protein [Bdellovibrionota bacterium]